MARITAIGHSYRGDSYKYQKEYQVVKDSQRLNLRKGDVVQVSKWCRSKYARNQFGVIVGRYRWVKWKGGEPYRDYGAVVLFITGKRKGKEKKFYTSEMGLLKKY